METSKFGAHGEVKASFDPRQNILFIDLIGPFNLEFMSRYETVVGAQRAKIESPCWASLVNVNGLGLAPMAATTSAHDIVEKAEVKGLVATAIILNETEGLELQKKFWTRLYTGSSLAFSFFSNKEDALAWLQQHIDSCEQTTKAGRLA